MMNVIEVQDSLKNFSQDQLVKEMQQPSGSAPQFLVLSELNRRKRVKGEFEARQASTQQTVAQDTVASAGVPQNQMMGMSEAMAPQSAESGGIGAMMPQTMKNGGNVEEYAEGGIIKAANGASLADRNYNPGNIRKAGFIGETGENAGYSTYASPEFGLRAMSRLSNTYADKGISTVRDFISRYAPASDNNKNNEQYAKMVAGALGVGIDDPVDFSNDAVKQALIPAMAQFEGYTGDTSPDLINKGIAASKTEDVTKVNELLSGIDSLSGDNSGGEELGVDVSYPQAGNYGSRGQTSNLSQGTLGQGSGEYLDNRNESQSNVPKGVRPDFTIDSIPQNTRELAYLKQLKLQNDLEQNKPRPNLSEILSNKVKQSADYDLNVGENMGKNVDQKTLDLMSQQEKDFVQNNLFNSINTIKDEDQPKSTTFKDTNKFNNVLKGLITPENVNYVGENLEFNAGANTPELTAEEFKKFQDKIAAGEGANTASTLFGASNNVNMSSKIKNSDQIKDIKTNSQTEKSNYTFADGSPSTSLSSTEQEILDLQRELKKDRDFDRYMALAQVGLNLMDQQGYGEAMNTGLKTLGDSQKRYSDGVTSLINARAKLKTASGKGVMTTKEAYDKLNDVREKIHGKQGDLSTVALDLKPEELEKYKAEERFLLEYMNKRGFKIPVYNPNLDPAA